MKSKKKIIKDDSEKVIHKNTKCSKCGKSPIEGIRYICLQCKSYELCQSCEKKYGEKHGHPLLMLRRAEDFDKFKNYFFNKKKVEELDKIEEEEKKTIDLSKCYSKVLNLNNLYITRNNNNFIPIELILKNTGDEQWPCPCFFTCNEESEVKGNRIKLVKFTGKSGEEYKLKIKIILNNIKKTGVYKSIWQLRNEKGEPFGEKVEFIIKDIFEKDIKIKDDKNKKSEVKDYRDELEESINEIKQKYDIMFTTESIKNALIRTKGNKENAIKILLTEQKKK